MSDTNYPGIDYGMGQTNIDRDTGIRFGVINANAQGLTEWFWESFEPDYGPATCPDCGNELQDEELPEVCPVCGEGLPSEVSDCLPDEALGHVLDDGEYIASVDSYNDCMILKSPYYTHAQFCSPCAPGAGHLENPCADGPRTYCFGHEWFDGGKAPYPVYRVADGSIVDPE